MAIFCTVFYFSHACSPWYALSKGEVRSAGLQGVAPQPWQGSEAELLPALLNKASESRNKAVDGGEGRPQSGPSLCSDKPIS